MRFEAYAIPENAITAKWSAAILEHGFTAVPNLLFSHRKVLGLTAPELFVLIAIESFRWDTKDPWPSLKALSERSGYSTRNISRIITSLEKKRLIKRIKRRGTSNQYSLEPLIDELNLIAQNVPKTGKRRRQVQDIIEPEIVTILSPK